MTKHLFDLNSSWFLPQL